MPWALLRPASCWRPSIRRQRLMLTWPTHGGWREHLRCMPSPARRHHSEPHNQPRPRCGSIAPEVDFVAIGVDPGPELPDRVERRFDTMLQLGLEDEVRRLQPRLGRMAAQAVGYKELLPVVIGMGSLTAGREAAIRATRALAKRQRTFFRRDPRIRWVAWDPDPAVRLHAALDYLDGTAAWTS